MIRIATAVLALVLAAGLVGCTDDAAQPNISGTPAPPEQPGPPPVFSLQYSSVTLSRGGCFGTCPVYTVTIDGTGHVSWEGQYYVAVEGAAEADVDVAAYTDLLRAFIAARYLEAEEAYTQRPALLVRSDGTCEMGYTTMVDGSTAALTLRMGLYAKSVSLVYGAPQELQALCAMVDAAANTAPWVDGESR
ncbi:MAG TPA: DUF6438 domain-containing protein [Candidatus Krumholzibacteria bacterium]|nr:DUF6438 domain-containing protein [Candidatus Krumholzibacteria bacterium]